MNTNKLTPEEALFCELYVHGDAPYTGNPAACYREAFGLPATSKTGRLKAKTLLKKEYIKNKVAELQEFSLEDEKAMKSFLTENLVHIVEECSIASFRDRKGTALSPAALRSVAVNASKALMDMYPIKEAQSHNISIDSTGEGGITFNVIMPEQTHNIQLEKKEAE